MSGLPADLPVVLRRTFGGDWESRWKTGAAGDKELGAWEHTAGSYYGGEEDAAKGIVTTEDMRHYFLATKTDTFSNKGTDLVLQYSVKFTKTPECGGSYIKLLGETDPEKFDNDTQYKCVLSLRCLVCAGRGRTTASVPPRSRSQVSAAGP